MFGDAWHMRIDLAEQGDDTIDIIANNQIDQKVVEFSSSQRYSLVENSM